MGPVTYAQHLISTPRLPFTAAYFGSIGLTLFFAIKVRRISFLSTVHVSQMWFMNETTHPLIQSFGFDQRPADHSAHMTAAQHYPDTCVRYLPVSVACLVSCQLFPHGRHRVEVCRTLRNQQAFGLDDRLIYVMILSKPSIILSSAIPKPFGEA